MYCPIMVPPLLHKIIFCVFGEQTYVDTWPRPTSTAHPLLHHGFGTPFICQHVRPEQVLGLGVPRDACIDDVGYVHEGEG